MQHECMKSMIRNTTSLVRNSVQETLVINSKLGIEDTSEQETAGPLRAAFTWIDSGRLIAGFGWAVGWPTRSHLAPMLYAPDFSWAVAASDCNMLLHRVDTTTMWTMEFTSVGWYRRDIAGGHGYVGRCRQSKSGGILSEGDKRDRRTICRKLLTRQRMGSGPRQWRLRSGASVSDSAEEDLVHCSSRFADHRCILLCTDGIARLSGPNA